MNKQEAIERLEAIQKEAEELKKIIEQSEKWQDGLVQPDREQSWYISESNIEGFKTNVSTHIIRKPEHAFKTEEQAELVKEKMLLMQEMLAFVHVRNEGKQFDWINAGEEKYGIRVENNHARVYICSTVNLFVFGIAVKSHEIANEMLELFRERLKKYYNQQY